ncbi:MAG TPA: ATP-binding protein [Aggregatilinea sp.]|uniref:sensor histidine kinase n=1 Tax=Aggregatilinea sp. TaxID=2806333 RepID=UPI002BA9AFD5|nr:ATP-binding protein [Aggregatilinea sp.]HML22054.1 ATP-binding protein [Aggregatilinea sp.]
MTIRTRLTFLYSSLLAIVILMFSTATSGILNWTLRNQVDESLYKALGDMQTSALTSSSQNGNSWMAWKFNNLLSSGVFVQIWSHDEQSQEPYLYETSLSMGNDLALDPAVLTSNDPVYSDVYVRGAHLRVAASPLRIGGDLYGYIQVATSLRTVDAAIDRLLKIMLISGAFTLLASLLLGDLLARRALKPIETIGETARQITAADDLGRRIPNHGPQDEIGRLATTFNQTLERLEQLFNVQRRFVADVSHEMRTPLTSIQGNLDLMRRIGYDEEAMEAIESESRRMTRLVDDLLLLAKADAGRLPLDQGVVDLDTMVLEVYNQAQMLAHGVALHLGDLDQAQVLGDADRLKQLLLNLVSNGLKYTPEGGSVTISLARDGDRALVTVCDTGIGIPETDLPHIFDRFYRVDKARSRAQGGTGLGLSIAKWIADAHGGDLDVTSHVGSGTTFTLWLPLVHPVVPDVEPDDSPARRRTRVPRFSRP